MVEPVEKRRQRLRELDSLLEQMLALPISDRKPRVHSDEPPPAPAAEEKPAARALVWPVRAAQEAHAVQVERVVTFISAEPEAAAPGLQPPPDDCEHLDETTEQAAEHPADVAAAPEDELFAEERWQASLHDPTQVDVRPSEGFDLAKGDLLSLVGVPVLDLHPVGAPLAPPGLCRRLLIGVNALYDRFCDTLWPIGGLLKWSGTRNLLGVLGIILMLAAAVWLLATQFVEPR